MSSVSLEASKKRKRTENGETDAQRAERKALKKAKREQEASEQEAAKTTADGFVPLDVPASDAKVAEKAARKLAKRELKEQKKALEIDANGIGTAVTSNANETDTKEAKDQAKVEKKDKKEKKAMTESDGAAKAADTANADTTSTATRKPKKNPKSEEKTDGEKESKDARFIVFIGNLPYSATQTSISHHFKSCPPDSIRLITDKATGKPKGFCFIEFNHYDRMKSCLKSYHHSSFDDGISPARQINVELTAGGGGSGKDRLKKIVAKNSKLMDERRRRMKEEFKTKKEKEGASEKKEAEDLGLHPSRMKNLAKGKKPNANDTPLRERRSKPA